MDKRKGEPDWAQNGSERTYSTSGDAELARQSVTDGEIQAVRTIEELIQDAWDKNSNSLGHQEFIAERRDELRNARNYLAALRQYRKPEPCEVVMRHRESYGGYDYAQCPDCKKLIPIHRPIAIDLPYCGRCGHALDDADAKFCSDCGRPLGGDKP